MCNVTYRLEKIDILILFELDDKVMDVTTQITVDISYITNCTNPDKPNIKKFLLGVGMG